MKHWQLISNVTEHATFTRNFCGQFINTFIGPWWKFVRLVVWPRQSCQDRSFAHILKHALKYRRVSTLPKRSRMKQDSDSDVLTAVLTTASNTKLWAISIVTHGEIIHTGNVSHLTFLLGRQAHAGPLPLSSGLQPGLQLLLAPLPKTLSSHLFALRLLSKFGQGVLLSASLRLVLGETVVADTMSAGLCKTSEQAVSATSQATLTVP